MSSSTKLIHDYIKCGNLKVAESLWNNADVQYKTRNIKSYGLMMNAYIKHGEYHKCLQMFEEINDRQMEANDVIYLLLLKSFNKSNNIEATKLIHYDIMHNNKHIYNNIKIQNVLIDIYSKHEPSTAFTLYHDLNSLHLTPNIATYLTVFKLIGNTNHIQSAIKIHQNIKRMPQYFHDIKIQNALISMYSLCGDFDSVIHIFNEIKNGNINECKMDDITYLNVIKCCSQHKRLNEAKQIHKEIMNTYLMNNIKLQNAFINMYYNCCDYVSALHVFNRMRRKDITSYSIAFKVCAKTRDLINGKRIHEEFMEQHTDVNNIWFYNELMNMYSKCGDIHQTEKIWKFIKNHNLIDTVSYGIIMTAYVQQKDNKKKYNAKALKLFDGMNKNIHNEQIIANALMSCSHLKLMNKAIKIYTNYKYKYKDIDCNIIIQNCMISLFANCNSFDESWNVYLNVKKKQIMDGITFVNVLSACCKHKKVNELNIIEDDINVLYKNKNEIDIRIYNALLKAYTRCSDVVESERVFEIMKCVNKQDIIGYNLMLALYLETNDIDKLNNLYEYMQQDPYIICNLSTYLLLIKSCRMKRDLCNLNKIKAHFEQNMTHFSNYTKQIIEEELVNTFHITDCK